jgi:hypothetical protein
MLNLGRAISTVFVLANTIILRIKELFARAIAAFHHQQNYFAAEILQIFKQAKQ